MPSLSNPDLLQTGAFIDGQFVTAQSGDTISVKNPSTGETVADVASCSDEDTRNAINAANRAFCEWRQRSGKDRARLLMDWRDALIEHKRDLAIILSQEQGKPLAEAEGEILYGASYVEWFAEEAKRIYGDILSPISNDARLLCIKQPIGVVACITPWNFPNAMLARKIAPALAAGCTVVCKPANETPLSALAMAKLASDVSIPAGVINILAGKTAEIGRELTASPIVRKLTFTGSTPVGKLLTEQCAATLKRTSMELGGNAPFIVFESADIDAAVRGLIANKFRNAGQTCVCTNRVLVHASIADAFSSRLEKALRTLKIGDAFDDGVAIGPHISENAVNKVNRLTDDARKKGADIIIAGDISGMGPNFLAPQIVCNARPDMEMFSEEIFGPIAAIYPFTSEDEAIELANDTPFGLAAYFYSNDLSQIWRVSEAIEAGMVGINDAVLSSETIPFGGVKESGQGREGSKYGLDDYLEIKHLKMGGLSS